MNLIGEQQKYKIDDIEGIAKKIRYVLQQGNVKLKCISNSIWSIKRISRKKKWKKINK